MENDSQQKKKPAFKIPEEFMGEPIAGALERLEAAEATKRKQEVEAVIKRLTAVEESLRGGRAQLVTHPIRTVILVCLAVGSVCVGSTILKSWLGTPNALDWGILFAGLVLCGMSLFKQFKLGKEGLSASMKDFVSLLQDTRSLIGNLLTRE